MKESVFKSYEELPLFLNAETMAKVLGASPSSGYGLMRKKDFPALKIGSRIVVPKERKYVLSLEDKALILTEPTAVYTKSGMKRNGSLLYTIRPIQEALDLFYARQMAQVDEDVAKLASVSPCTPLCGAWGI